MSTKPTMRELWDFLEQTSRNSHTYCETHLSLWYCEERQAPLLVLHGLESAPLGSEDPEALRSKAAKASAAPKPSQTQVSSWLALCPAARQRLKSHQPLLCTCCRNYERVCSKLVGAHPPRWEDPAAHTVLQTFWTFDFGTQALALTRGLCAGLMQVGLLSHARQLHSPPDHVIQALIQARVRVRPLPSAKAWLAHYASITQQRTSNNADANVSANAQDVVEGEILEELVVEEDLEEEPEESLESTLEEPTLPLHPAVSVGCAALWQYLYPYQREGLIHILRHQGRAVIADEMGLGKTLQGVAALCHYAEWPAVVVCPGAVMLHWKTDLEQWLPPGVEVVRIKSWKTQASATGVTVISYDMLLSPKWQSNFLKLTSPSGHPVRAVVADECHYVKNQDAQRTQAVQALCRVAQRVVLLSGTPMNCPSHLFSQLLCLGNWFPHYFPKYRGQYTAPKKADTTFYFAARYCQPQQKFVRGSRKVFVFNGSSHEDELYAVLRSLGMLRRLKQTELPEMPAKHRERVVISEYPVSLRPAVAKKQLSDADFKTESGFMAEVMATCQFKKNAVEAYLKQVVVPLLQEDPTQKVIIGARHRLMLDACKETLMQAKFETVAMDGRTSATERDKAVQRFQTDPSLRAVVLSSALSCGITLTAATLVVMAELAYSPDVLLQMEDRAHRCNQTQEVTVQYLVCKGSTDDMVWQLVSRKIVQATACLEGQERPWKYRRTNEEARVAAGLPEVSECGLMNEPLVTPLTSMAPPLVTPMAFGH